MTNPGLSEQQAREVLAALAASAGNKMDAADRLGLPESTFRNRLKRAQSMFPAWGTRDQPTHEELPAGDLPIEQIIDTMSERFERRHARESAKRWMDVKIPIDGPFAVAWIGDPHLDSPGCHWPLLRSHLDLFAKHRDFVFCVSVGDAIDNWPKSGRLAALHAQSDTSESTAWRLVEWFLHRAGVNWLAWLLGNHDMWGDAARIFKAIAAQRILVEEWGAKFQLVPPRGEPYRIWASHNFAGHSQWNPLHGPMKAARMRESADVYVAGHTHTWALHTEEQAARGTISDVVRARGYKFLDEYAERLGFDSDQHGASVVTVFNPDASNAAERQQTFRSPELAVRFCEFLRGKRGRAKR